MKIGILELENNILLAPMAGVTDAAFRSLCREQGAGLTYTEMVSAKAMSYNNANTASLMRTADNERPAALQIFGSEPEVLAAMARRAEDMGFDLIDINMGCPAPKIVRNGEGSALMRDTALIGRIVRAVSGAVSLPVTVKLRKGFNSASVNAVDAARIAEENGAAGVTVHGRTREQYYSGIADWEIIARVRESVGIPVIGNGDVDSPIKAERMLRETGCAAVMIGRAAEGNPWIFARTLHYLRAGEELPEPDMAERTRMALEHARRLIALKGEYIACREMRRHLCRYIRGVRGASGFRGRICGIETYGDIEALFHEIMYEFSGKTQGLSP